MNRSIEKTERVLKAMQHQEADRLPVAEWFAGEFTTRWIEWRKKTGQNSDANVVTASWAAMGDSAETDPNRFYDIDVMLVVPNSDPQIHHPRSAGRC